jgi:hypothetical protein
MELTEGNRIIITIIFIPTIITTGCGYSRGSPRCLLFAWTKYVRRPSSTVITHRRALPGLRQGAAVAIATACGRRSKRTGQTAR